MNKNLLTAAGVIAAGLIAGPFANAGNSHHARPNSRGGHAITVKKIAFQGWKDAYQLSNGIVDVVVVPAVGCVMAYNFANEPAGSPIWVSPEWAGKTSDPDPNKYQGYGGSRLWPSPQDDWPKHQGRGWPPEPIIDHGPYKLTLIKNGVRLTGSTSKNYALRAVRDITLVPGDTRLNLKGTFYKSADASGDKDAFPIGVWTNTTVKADSKVYIPLNRQSIFKPKGYVVLRENAKPAPYYVVADGVLTITRDPATSGKIGNDDVAGWFAVLYNKNLLYSQHFTRVSGAEYPDKNTNMQVYTNADPSPFIEVEALGPLRKLRAGKNMTELLTWNIQRLPRVPKSDADARKLVKAAMH